MLPLSLLRLPPRETLLVPGFIPDLLTRGCPVWHPTYGRGLVDRRSDGEMVVRDEQGMTRWLEGSDPDRTPVDQRVWWQLDLGEEIGLFRALCWLAGRVASGAGLGASWFRYEGVDQRPAWMIRTCPTKDAYSRIAKFSAEMDLGSGVLGMGLGPVQGLSEVVAALEQGQIDPKDPYVDRWALAVVVKHVAERPGKIPG